MNAGQPKKYLDKRGWKYQVMPGISANSYKARYQKPDKHGLDGWKCLAKLPWRKTTEEAQDDLDRLAEKKGWSEWKD